MNPIQKHLAEAHKMAIRIALIRNRGHRTFAAKELGISQASIYRSIQAYNIDVPPESKSRRRYLRPVSLTDRQMEVWKGIASSKTNKEIAAAMGIGIKGIENHRAALQAALNIHDVAGLTRAAILRGMVNLL